VRNHWYILLIVLFVLSAPALAAPGQTIITGAGATFPYPLYATWFKEYARVDPSVTFNYQPIGSGSGVRQMLAGTLDFSATDKFLSDEQLKSVPEKILHIPTVIGAVAITYNIPGIGKGLKLTPDVVADIFLGRIVRWNDPRIAALNKNLRLPDKEIAVVHRSDGSGTTSIFTDYLSAVSSSWARLVGRGTTVSWPVGYGREGNAGVTVEVKRRVYSIGYSELIYASEENLAYAAIRNRSGRFVLPDLKTISAAVAQTAASIPADYRTSLVNQPGRDSYPMAGFTWLLVHQHQRDPVKGKKLVEFLNWSIRHGQKMAYLQLYVPLPPRVATMVEETIKSIRYSE